MKRSLSELKNIHEEMLKNAHAGDGLHYELFESRYSGMVDGFRDKLTDPDELRGFNSMVQDAGIYTDPNIDPKIFGEFRKKLAQNFDQAEQRFPGDSAHKEYRETVSIPANQQVEIAATQIRDLRVGPGAVLLAPNLQGVDGELELAPGSVLHAPNLLNLGHIGSHEGIELGNGFYESDFTARSKDGMDLSTIRIDGATLDAPRLQRIDGDLSVAKTSLTLPGVIRIRGGIELVGAPNEPCVVTLPKLTRFGTQVSYLTSEESKATLTSSSSLQDCVLATPALTGFRGYMDKGPNVAWEHPLTLELAAQTDRVAEIPNDALKPQILSAKNPADFVGFAESRGSGFLADVLVEMGEISRLLAYLDCSPNALSEADTRQVIGSIPPSVIIADDLYRETPGEWGTEYDQVDGVKEIRARLKLEGRDQLATEILKPAETLLERQKQERLEIDKTGGPSESAAQAKSIRERLDADIGPSPTPVQKNTPETARARLDASLDVNPEPASKKFRLRDLFAPFATKADNSQGPSLPK